MEMRSEDTEQDDGDDESAESEADTEEGEATSAQDGADQARAEFAPAELGGRAGHRLRPFTTRFDEMVAAAELCDEEEWAGFAPISTSR
jgi:cobaltochelatase CobT